ncbi:MAG: hypothetical protein U0228_03610 [Myxococcaceae bacterium]
MRTLPALGLAVLTLTGVALSGCDKKDDAPSKRAALNRTGGSTFEIIPSAGQYPHCLAYTVSRSGLTRQLTMSRSNMSFECAPGRPLGGHSYRVPTNEGPVRVFVFFTSQPVNAASVSQQLLDAPDRQALSVMNMRLPGNASLEVLDFTPEEDVAPEVGALVGVDAGTPAEAPPAATPDAG